MRLRGPATEGGSRIGAAVAVLRDSPGSYARVRIGEEALELSARDLRLAERPATAAGK